MSLCQKLRIGIFALTLIAFLGSGCNSPDPEPILDEWTYLEITSGVAGPPLVFFNADTGFLSYGFSPDALFSYTYDGGITWSSVVIEEFTSIGFRNLTVSMDGVLYADGWTGSLDSEYVQLNRSFDFGKSWERVEGNYPHHRNHHILHFFDRKDGITYTNADGIRITLDGGENWVLKMPHDDQYNNFNKSSFPVRTTGYLTSSVFWDQGPNYGLIVRTLDGGETWTKIPKIFKAISSIHFLTKEIGFVSTTEPPELYKTEDSGDTWELITDQLPVHPTQLHFFSEGEGIVLGQGTPYGGYIYRTYDGGKTWRVEYKIKQGEFVDAFVLDRENIFIYGGLPDGTNFLVKRKE